MPLLGGSADMIANVFDRRNIVAYLGDSSINRRKVRGGSGNKGRVGGSSRHAQDGYLLEVWVLDFGGIGDGEAIVVSEGRALCGRWDVSIKEMLMAVWRKNVDGGGGVKLGTESRDMLQWKTRQYVQRLEGRFNS